MSGFAFQSAGSLEEALAVLARTEGETRIVAGGTNVVPAIRDGRQPPALLLDISRLDGLRGLREEKGKLWIGALTTLAELAASPLLAERAPALYQAANSFADPNTRGRATVAGNITNASPGADMAPPLLVLEAEVFLTGPAGHRSLPLREYLTGPFRAALTRDEIVTHLTISPQVHSAFIKIGLRRAMAISVATVAVALEKATDGAVTACRIAFGALGPTALRAPQAESVFLGRQPDSALFAAAAAAIAGDIQPRDGLRGTREYRLSAAGAILERAFSLAYYKEA
ncbi:MAG: FAD binding domain-containing protein [Peptococcaceae bacterium]|jgi:carbon-monoxide dehydrogenase medium subunit|nr:FAD binding domain-containing protein [Peptococcaceae bacterium]